MLERFAAVGDRPWSEREAAVAMAARYSSQKDHGTLIEAFALLAPRLPQARLDLYGGGKKRWQDRARRLIQNLGLGQRVQMHGHVRDMPEALSRHQVFVLSTHYEGIGLAVIEAMACGCACIATDVVGVQELIEHGVTGLLVPETTRRHWPRRSNSCSPSRRLRNRWASAPANAPCKTTATTSCKSTTTGW